MTPGTRVRLAHPSPLLTLRSPFGTIVRESEWGGYVVIRLDEPAMSYCGLEPEELIEVVEHPNNMEVVE